MNWNRAILKALSRLRESDLAGLKVRGDSGSHSIFGVKPGGLPVTYLVSALLCILFCALSSNAIFTVTVLAVLLARTAILPTRQLQRVIGSLAAPCIFTVIIMLPAVFLGSPATMLTVTMKVAEAVLVLALTGGQISFQKLTEGLRQLRFPDILILVLDLTIRFLVMLGRYSNALLEAVTMRSVGKVSWRDSGAGGILGTTFLKSTEMAQETEEAMRMRGFDGTYPSLEERRAGWKDLLMIAADAALIGLFIATNQG